VHEVKSTMGIMFDNRETPHEWTRAARRDGELPRAGELFDGRYRVGRVIGQGGMAYILSAIHVELDLLVAIKLLRPEGRECPDVVARFRREGRAAARIRSEHAARVIDVGSGAYGPFLVMEYLRGRDLEKVLRDEGPLPVERAVDYVLQACEAIAEAHAAGVVHRDLKPSNLFLARASDGSSCVKVLDFGISKLATDAGEEGEGEEDRDAYARAPTVARETDPTLFMGSPPYVSPEQAKSPRDVDGRTDIWALGATLHELLAGEPPFGLGAGPAILMRAATRRAPLLSTLRSDVPPGLEAAVRRCLKVDPRDRWGTVAEFAAAIAPFRTGGGRVSGRISAGRLERVSGSARDWASQSTVRRARVTEPVCARDVLAAGQTRVKSGIHARWGGYGLAVALLAMTCTHGVVRWDAARRALQTASAQASSLVQPLASDPSAQVARFGAGGGEPSSRAKRNPSGATLSSCVRTLSLSRPPRALDACKAHTLANERQDNDAGTKDD
jgi:hypothetical protein